MVFEKTNLLYLSVPVLVGYSKKFTNDRLTLFSGLQFDVRLYQKEEGYFTENQVRKPLTFQVNDYEKFVPYAILSLRYEKVLSDKFSIAIQPNFAHSLRLLESNFILTNNFKRTVFGLSFAAIHII